MSSNILTGGGYSLSRRFVVTSLVFAFVFALSSAVGRLTLGGGRFAAAVDFAVAFAFSIVAAVVLRVVFDRLAPLFSSRRDEGYFVLDRVFSYPLFCGNLGMLVLLLPSLLPRVHVR